MLSVACRDVGVDSDFEGSGEAEEELMNNWLIMQLSIMTTLVT